MNRGRGFLLLEITVAAMVTCLLFTAFYQSFTQMLFSMRRINSDVELYQAAQSIITSVESEIAYYSREVVLEENIYGSRIVCHNIGPRRSVTFYCRTVPGASEQKGIYKSTKIEGRSEGINPLSSSDISVEKWHCTVIDGCTLHLEMELKVENTGRCKTFVEVIHLCNGYLM